MIFADEYRIQGVIGALLAGMIIAGSLMVGLVLKARGYPDEFTEIPLQLLFIRNWGFTMILIPLSWVILTIWLERNNIEWFSKRWTIFTGIGLGCIIFWYLFISIARAGSSLIQHAGPIQ